MRSRSPLHVHDSAYDPLPTRGPRAQGTVWDHAIRNEIGASSTQNGRLVTTHGIRATGDDSDLFHQSRRRTGESPLHRVFIGGSTPTGGRPRRLQPPRGRLGDGDAPAHRPGPRAAEYSDVTRWLSSDLKDHETPGRQRTDKFCCCSKYFDRRWATLLWPAAFQCKPSRRWNLLISFCPKS